MTQAGLDFSNPVPGAYAKRGSVQARHASRKGAEDAANRCENQTARLLALYQSYPDGLTDWQAAKLLGVERTTVNARRAPLTKTDPPVVVANGHFNDGHSRIPNTRWALRALRGKGEK
jgi:hypothetical protein